jgi:hypothetical protein
VGVLLVLAGYHGHASLAKKRLTDVNEWAIYGSRKKKWKRGIKLKRTWEDMEYRG